MDAVAASKEITISVDRSRCAGHALCAAKAPELYELDDEGFCVSDGQTIRSDQFERAVLGVKVCPEKAITLSGFPESFTESTQEPSGTDSAVQITFCIPDQTSVQTSGCAGHTLLEEALKRGVEGLVAECGGQCCCATCHVYISESFLARLPSMSDLEDEMLEGVAAQRQHNSRLACQVLLTKQLSGMTVTIPSTQL